MFDPYHKWLGIPREEQPPNHYRLLGLSLLESDPEVIDAAANRQMAYLQGCATGTQALLSQRLLNEVAAARLCLLNPEKKVTYDARLRRIRSVGEDASAPIAPVSEQVPALGVRRNAFDKRFPVLEGIDEEADPYEVVPPPLKRIRAPSLPLKNRTGFPLVVFLVGTTLLMGMIAIPWAIFARRSQLNEGTSPVADANSSTGKSTESSESSEESRTVVADAKPQQSVESKNWKPLLVTNYSEDQFSKIFDGSSFGGWFGDVHLWRIDRDQGVIISDGEPYSCLICTGQTFEDFVLRFDFRVLSEHKSMQSGVGLRCGGTEARINLVISDGDSGNLLFKHRIADLKGPLVQKDLAIEDWKALIRKGSWNEKGLGEWNSCEVLCEGTKVVVLINGEVVNHVTTATKGSGAICLNQYGTKAEYRNLRFHRLAVGDQPAVRQEVEPPTQTPVISEKKTPGEVRLFNGLSLSGWTAIRQGKRLNPGQVFHVDQGELVSDRSAGGYLKTVDYYENFTLTLEYKFPKGGQLSNSGSGVLLVGDEPGNSLFPGIECQVMPGHTGDLYAVPGSSIGGIKRIPQGVDIVATAPAPMTPGAPGVERIPQGGASFEIIRKMSDAERPIGEWNDYKIRCEGPKITLGLNGRVVNQATSDRPIFCRIGLMCQMSDVRFRNIRIRTDSIEPAVSSNRLQGDWTMTLEELNGQRDTVTENRRVSISGDDFVMSRTRNGRNGVYVGKIRVDPVKQSFDFSGKGPNGAHQEFKGIYEIDGETLRLCYVYSFGNNAQRPTRLRSYQVSGTAMVSLVLKRESGK